MKVLIRLPNWIGDAVMATPAIRIILSKSGPDRSAVWGPSKTAALFHSYPGIDRVFEPDEKNERTHLEEIRREEFTHVWLLTNSHSTAKAARDLGIPNRIGYRRDFRGPLLTRAVWCGPRVRALHMREFYLRLLPPDWRSGPVDAQPRLHLSETERGWAAEKLTGLAGGSSDPIVGIAPGAAFGSAKQWDPERFEEVASALSRRGVHPVVLGTEAEREIGDRILSGIGAGGGANLAGETTLRELMALISACRALLTNDSGPMHLADALGTPTVALFGSTDSTWTGPTDSCHRVLQAEVACNPCFLRDCPLNRECMKSLTVPRVLEELGILLEGSG